ncbi:MbtH family protein [Marinobacter sp. DUT-3]|uniref:MbtH family protein n=1 Tax=unclassified Marinobacter TaxID=83889 RepID=UPI00387B4B24
MSLDSPETVFSVVVNDEEQYAIWPEYKPVPGGWREAGKTGSKDECLAFIRDTWTDMRPKSLREAMTDMS